MCRGFHLDCHAGPRYEIEWSIYLSRWRQTIQDIADKILSEHADV